MPKSDTWPGGIGLETMISMDSAGSCDSVVSANSGFVSYMLHPLEPEDISCSTTAQYTKHNISRQNHAGN